MDKNRTCTTELMSNKMNNLKGQDHKKWQFLSIWHVAVGLSEGPRTDFTYMYFQLSAKNYYFLKLISSWTKTSTDLIEFVVYQVAFVYSM